MLSIVMVSGLSSALIQFPLFRLSEGHYTCYSGCKSMDYNPWLVPGTWCSQIRLGI